MSKIINLEIVDILEGIAVLETETGFEVEIELESLPLNIKVGQSIKCALSLNPNTVHKEAYQPKEQDRIPNGKSLAY